MSNGQEIVSSGFGQYILPGGYIENGALHKDIVLKEMTGHEEDLMLAKGMEPLEKIRRIISNCIVRIGTISDEKRMYDIVGNLTIRDRAFLLFKLRECSLGSEYKFQAKCDNGMCGKEQSVSVNLNELVMKEMPNPGSKEYDLTLPSGKKFTGRIPTGIDEENFDKLFKRGVGKDVLSGGILMRCIKLDDKIVAMSDIKNLSTKDRNFLRNKFEEYEGGMEDDVEVECLKCGNIYKTSISVVDKNFFFPSE